MLKQKALQWILNEHLVMRFVTILKLLKTFIFPSFGHLKGLLDGRKIRLHTTHKSNLHISSHLHVACSHFSLLAASVHYWNVNSSFPKQFSLTRSNQCFLIKTFCFCCFDPCVFRLECCVYVHAYLCNWVVSRIHTEGAGSSHRLSSERRTSISIQGPPAGTQYSAYLYHVL